MRVIAGKYRGRKINPPKDNSVRPTSDKIKEALFDVLQNEVSDAVVIDLFAGTGALGIEALSRGAKKVYFCDKDARSIALLQSNLTFVEKGSYEILKGDYADILNRLSARGVKADLMLCDPPFADKEGGNILSVAAKCEIMAENGLITVERHSYDGEIAENIFFPEQTKRYGNVSLDFFRNCTKCALTGTFDPFTNGHSFLAEEALKQFGALYVLVLVNEAKTVTYSAEKRIKMIQTVLKKYRKRVKIVFYDGYAADYCKEHGIKYIIRGVRNEKDLAYEREMADYNFRRGGTETLFIPAVRPEISSTAVKEKLFKGEEVGDFVAEELLPMLAKEEKWKT